MYIRRVEVTVTTDANGDATAYSVPVMGQIVSVQYVKTDFADGVDFTVTTETTGRTVWNQDNVNASAEVLPRQQVHNTAGTALTYDGTRTVNEKIAVDNERIKIVIANGGDIKTGKFYITVG